MPFRWIGDNRGSRRQIGDDVVLEVEDQSRIVRQIGEPIACSRSGNSTEKDVVFESVKADLNTTGLSGSSTRRRDVNCAVLDAGGLINDQCSAYVISHALYRMD
jgi:hypothetical protein